MAVPFGPIPKDFCDKQEKKMADHDPILNSTSTETQRPVTAANSSETKSSADALKDSDLNQVTGGVGVGEILITHPVNSSTP